MNGARWLRGPALLPTGVHPDAAICVEGSRITWAGPRSDAPEISGRVLQLRSDWLLSPGYVDVHCHGGGGAAFGADPEHCARAVDFHARRGTTSVIASLVTAESAALVEAARTCAELSSAAVLSGIHLEGPFLSPERCGAHDPRWLRPVDLELLDQLIRAGDGALRTMTYAPELPWADQLVAVLLRHGVRPSVGHTAATASITSAALAAVAATGQPALVTHLFNAMPPWHSRAPGPVAAALEAAASGSAIVELIADGAHLAAETVAATFALAAPGCVALVSDATAAAGQPDGDYHLGSRAVAVRDGVARLAGGGAGALAGGTATLAEIVRGCIDAGLAVEDVLRAATSTPAAAVGLGSRVGRLQAGLRADVLVLDEDFAVRNVMRAGAWLDRTPDSC